MKLEKCVFSGTSGGTRETPDIGNGVVGSLSGVSVSDEGLCWQSRTGFGCRRRSLAILHCVLVSIAAAESRVAYDGKITATAEDNGYNRVIALKLQRRL